MSQRIHVTGAAAGLLVLGIGLTLGSCKSSDSFRTEATIEQYIPRVTTLDGSVVAVLRQGTPPSSNGAQQPASNGFPIVVTGGSGQTTISALQPFSTVIVAMLGIDNYWELMLPSPTPQVDLLYNVATNLPNFSFVAQYGVEAGGGISDYANQSVQVRKVGNGDVQVSVAWIGRSDVDLYVTDPSGETVYFGHRTSASGGTLDLDSNPACSFDDINNENIVWPAGVAPYGDYTVVVDYYDDCNAPRSDYVVTIQRKNYGTQVFTGSFVGVNGTPSGTQQTTFTF